MKNFKGKSILAIVSLSLLSLVAATPTSADTDSFLADVNAYLGIGNSVGGSSQAAGFSSNGGDDWLSAIRQQSAQESAKAKVENEVNKKKESSEEIVKQLSAAIAKRNAEMAKIEKRAAEAEKALIAERKKKEEEEKKAEEQKKAELKKQEEKRKREEKKQKNAKGKNKGKDKGKDKGKFGNKRSKSAKGMRGRTSLKKLTDGKGKSDPLAKLKALRNKGAGDANGDMSTTGGVQSQTGAGTRSEVYGRLYDVSSLNEMFVAYCEYANSIYAVKDKLESLKKEADNSKVSVVQSSAVTNILNSASGLPDDIKTKLTGLATGGVASNFTTNVKVTTIGDMVKAIDSDLATARFNLLQAAAFANDTNGSVKKKLESFAGFDKIDANKRVITAQELAVAAPAPFGQPQVSKYSLIQGVIGGLDVANVSKLSAVMHSKDLTDDQILAEVQKLLPLRQVSWNAADIPAARLQLDEFLAGKLMSVITDNADSSENKIKDFDQLMQVDKDSALILAFALVCLKNIDARFADMEYESTMPGALTMKSLFTQHYKDMVESFNKDYKALGESNGVGTWYNWLIVKKGADATKLDATAMANFKSGINEVMVKNPNAFGNLRGAVNKLFDSGFDGDETFLNSKAGESKTLYTAVVNTISYLKSTLDNIKGDLRKENFAFWIVKLMNGDMLKKFGNSNTTLTLEESGRTANDYTDFVKKLINKSEEVTKVVEPFIKEPDVTKSAGALIAAKPYLSVVCYPLMMVRQIVEFLNRPASDFKSILADEFPKLNLSKPDDIDWLSSWMKEGSSDMTIADALRYTFDANLVLYKLLVPRDTTAAVNAVGNDGAVFNGSEDTKIGGGETDIGQNIATKLAGGTVVVAAAAFGNGTIVNNATAAYGLMFNNLRSKNILTKAKAVVNHSTGTKKVFGEEHSNGIRGPVANATQVGGTYLGTSGANSEIRKSDYWLNHDGLLSSSENVFKTTNEFVNPDSVLHSTLNGMTKDGGITEDCVPAKSDLNLLRRFLEVAIEYIKKLPTSNDHNVYDNVKIPSGDTVITGLKDGSGNAVSLQVKTAFDAVYNGKLKKLDATDLSSSSISPTTGTQGNNKSVLSDDDFKQAQTYATQNNIDLRQWQNPGGSMTPQSWYNGGNNSSGNIFSLGM